MDWTKAKSILIVALIFTNIVLLCVNISNRMSADRTRQVTEKTIAILEQKNVALEVELPLKKEKLPVLSVRYSSYDEETVMANIMGQSAQYREDSREGAIAAADAFLEECGFMDENVALDNCLAEDAGYTVIYKNVMEGWEIEESYMICRVKNGAVTDFNRQWLTPIEFGTNTKEVIPVTTALMKFISEKPEGRNVINDISMVYWLDRGTDNVNPEQAESDTALPTWRIRYNGGKEMFIIAYEII